MFISKTTIIKMISEYSRDLEKLLKNNDIKNMDDFLLIEKKLKIDKFHLWDDINSLNKAIYKLKIALKSS